MKRFGVGGTFARAIFDGSHVNQKVITEIGDLSRDAIAVDAHPGEPCLVLQTR